jgi:hypothetical protein
MDDLRAYWKRSAWVLKYERPHRNLAIGLVVVREGIVRVRVLVENDAAGDRVAQTLGDADQALGIVVSTG